MRFVHAVWMGAFHSLMVLVPTYPLGFNCAFAIELGRKGMLLNHTLFRPAIFTYLVVVVSLAFRKGLIAFLAFVESLDFTTLLAWD